MESQELQNSVNVLFLADVIGASGFDAVRRHLPEIQSRYRIHLTVANGENAAHGKGLTPKTAAAFFGIGVNVITSGNHIWNQKSILPMLDENPHVLRPLNYPPGCPGRGWCEFEISQGLTAAIVNLQGRSFLYPVDCPFRAADEVVQRCSERGIRIILLDFHAEATAEKAALAFYLDGRVSAVAGTHTHVQTADERILPKGTAFITDLGMSGPMDSVIGMDTETAILRFMTQIPIPYRASTAPSSCSGAVVQVNSETGKAKSIVRFQLPHDPRP
jgi:metallophosphoesterase (TIGR00282 family)